MKFFGIWFSVLLIFSSPGWAEEPDITGSWKFTEIIYRGKLMPPLNPNLNIIWTFYDNGSERLFWNRNDEMGFCERFANFRFFKGYLEEDVFAVNPKNAQACGKDPDMQVGRKTRTKMEFETDRILLHFQMGDEELIYVLKKTFQTLL